MSTDLSQHNFPDQSQRGFLSALLETVRPTLREAARFVRMEAAWRTWPSIHRVAKALQEGLTTDADRAAQRQDQLETYAARIAKCTLLASLCPILSVL